MCCPQRNNPFRPTNTKPQMPNESATVMQSVVLRMAAWHMLLLLPPMGGHCRHPCWCIRCVLCIQVVIYVSTWVTSVSGCADGQRQP